MSGLRRIAEGVLTDATQPVEFEFDGRRVAGLQGDTVASALLASGTPLVGRSFKYHRPRGVVSAGFEEPCALVDVVAPRGRVPNRLATTLPIAAGLRVVSQNRWPSLGFDVLAVNNLLARWLPAGFYYKTFKNPGWAWERVYEPLIRRAAGLGQLDVDNSSPLVHGDETVHDHADVLIVGTGAAGLAAARELARSDAQVLLLERDVLPGGGTVLDSRWRDWREATLGLLARQPNLRILTNTQVIGAYGHGVFAALESLPPAGAANGFLPRERLRVVRARRVLLASGATERWLACPGNDRPGVILAGAALAYLRRYGVAVGKRPVLFVNSDWAYESAFALHAAGVSPQAIIDPRATSRAADRAAALGIPVHRSAVISAIHGRRAVRGVSIASTEAAPRGALETDSVLLSGGYQPESALATQAGGRLEWRDDIAAFVPTLPSNAGAVTGAARGVLGLAAAARDGIAAAQRLAHELQCTLSSRGSEVDLPPDPEVTALQPLWEIPGRGKAFVDLQNDVTADDVRLAHREGYEHIEHMKRYTTHGMATDQGRIGGVLGAAVLAAARGQSPGLVGVPTPRPFVQPASFAALAGGEVGTHLKPVRRFPAHESHVAADATFIPSGLWLRPLVYSQQTGWDPVLREARAVREAVGICDASSLGKIDVQGPDAARFLDFVYANRFSNLAIGKARYGIMLREDGFLLDDGTTSRLGERHFILTTTTANNATVLEHLEFQLQANWPDWDVILTDVTDQWAQICIAGPHSRELLQKLMPGVDVTNNAVPFMAAMPATIAGCAGRLFRISFSGELAYEVAVPAMEANAVWSKLLEAGRPLGALPYGVDALNTLRIEKGHVTTAELDGNATAHDLGFERMLKPQGDYVGRVLAQRPALTSSLRRQLVAVRPTALSDKLRSGMALVTTTAPKESIGYVTSATPMVVQDGWIGLALLANGRQRHGEKLLAVSPLHQESVEVEVGNPHWFDPESGRVRA